MFRFDFTHMQRRHAMARSKEDLRVLRRSQREVYRSRGLPKDCYEGEADQADDVLAAASGPSLEWRPVQLGKPKDLDEYLCLTEEGRLVVLRCNPEVSVDPESIWWDTLHDSGRVVAWAEIPKPDLWRFKPGRLESWDE